MKTLFFITALLCIITNLFAQSNKPYFEKKMVLARNIPIFNNSENMGFLRGMRYETLMGKEDDERNGSYKTYTPLISVMTNPQKIEDALAYEILAAKKMGIDGFKFPVALYASVNFVDKYIDLVSLYVNTAEKRGIDFNFSLLVKLNRNKNKVSEEEAYNQLVSRLKQLYANTKYSSKWLRNSEGELVIFTRETDLIVDRAFGLKNVHAFVTDGKIMDEIKAVFDRVETEVDSNLSFIFNSRHPFTPRYNDLVLQYFPGITLDKYAMPNKEGVKKMAIYCKERNKPVFLSVFADLLNSQTMSKETGKMIFENSPLGKKLSMDELYVLTNSAKLTANYRYFLQAAVDVDADVIDISSWNSYEEGSQIAPEIHHGFGYGEMLKYYKDLWINGEHNTTIEQEKLITSYKAYDSKYMAETNMEVRYGLTYYPHGCEDSVEIVTILNEPATVYCNGRNVGTVGSGLQSIYIPKKTGNVKVAVKRGSQVIIEYITPKKIIDDPIKSDYLTYSFTNVDHDLNYSYLKMNFEVEMKRLNRSFILNEKIESKWEEAYQKRYEENIDALYTYFNQPRKYLQQKKKIEKEYRKEIQKLMSDFDYEIWVEMEEDRMKKEGIINMYTPTKSLFTNYNILEIEAN